MYDEKFLEMIDDMDKLKNPTPWVLWRRLTH